ncbi:glutamate-5-semialdehyde dehydrogenase [Erysipelotrichaceae bacterium OttesenSCG-928-M19]|nr:glutamate-5-semialdehyde dehydrogenase [Erysipelotrichaceae bacterium OttesenSCG-928-M19]
MNDYLITIGKNAKQAEKELKKTSMQTINNALQIMAQAIDDNVAEIIAANLKDIESAKNKISQVMLDRLTLNEKRVQNLAYNLRLVASLESPLDKVTYSYQNLNGFKITTVTVPLGVIAMIYEARPNVTTEAMSLALKTGNAIILRGSSSTLNTNKKLLEIIRECGKKADLPENFVQLIETTSYEDISNLVKMNDYIDVVIPRGGEKLIQNVVNNATVPIIETGTGNNFAYIDASADIDQAIKVLVNAKVQRPTVCNALEKILVHKDVSAKFYQQLEQALKEANVIIKAHSNVIDKFMDVEIFDDEELALEYLDYIIGIKQVNNLDEAISIINNYSSKHSNLILSTQLFEVERFTSEIDSACVFVNVSTRFADGVEFGLGSEIGISTQKTHARGPMGLSALTSTKSIISGQYNDRK